MVSSLGLCVVLSTVRVVPSLSLGLCVCVVLSTVRVAPGLSDVVPLPLVLLGLTVVKLGNTVASVTVLCRVEKLSRMVLIRVEEVEEMGDVAGGVVGLDVAVDVVSDLCLVCEEDCLMLLAPKSLRTFVLLEFLSWDWPLLFCLFFLLLFLFLLL